MPPRTAKKAAGPGTKRAARARGTLKAQQELAAAVEEPAKVEEVKEVEEEVVKVETVSVEVREEVKVVEEKKVVDDDVEERLEETGLDPSNKEEEEVKEYVEEYEKGERLDLEDNDPEEYEPEEEGGVDYDEKEIEQEDVREEVDELEEEVEDGDIVEEEEGDMAEEEMEDAPEELEGEEDEEHDAEEHDAEEHAEMVDIEEREEHRNVFKERRKRKEFEIFVGGLDKDATEDDLRKVFREVGEVTEVRLMMNAQTKKKRFAFLCFATVEQAKRACAELKNPVVNGKQCGVTPSQDSDTLFLGNICKSWTKEALKEKLKHYGVETLEDLTLVEDSNNEGMNRGFAFLEFSSRSDAMDAFKRLQKRDVLFGVDRPAKVSFAAQIDPDDEEMAQVNTIFVDGLPASWDEDRVRELLKKYGVVVKIELARNMPSAKRKDFGFVTFGTHDEAVTCANSINNETLGEGESKAKVRARLSRPLQRGRGKLASRGDFRLGRAASGGFRSPWARPVPRALPVRRIRRMGGRLPPVVDRGLKRPVGVGDRRPVMALPPRRRSVVPLPRSSDRRPPVPAYPKSSMKRDYVRREELPPRSRAAAEYGPRGVASERRSSYRDEYSSRGSAYADVPRGVSRSSASRSYADDGYGQRFERPPPSYREGRPREYDSVSGSKRPYSAMDDVPPRYAEAGVRQSRARLDYELGSGASQYGDGYSDRLGRSNIGYSSSRSSIPGQDSHGLYSRRQGMPYGGGSYGGGDVGGMYSSSFGGDYASRGGDVGGSSYSSLYSGRSLGGSSYMGSGGSGSYY